MNTYDKHITLSPRVSLTEVIEKLQSLRAVIFDVDGVVFPAIVNEGAPVRVKTRSYSDGQGISLLRAIGIRVAFVTNERGDHAAPIEGVVSKWNRLPSSKSLANQTGWEHVQLFTGRSGERKVEAAEEFLEGIGVSFGEAAAMGDDLVDAKLLMRVAVAVAPSQAEWVIKDICQVVTNRPGGAGAIRDFANFLLEVRGLNPLDYAPN